MSTQNPLWAYFPKGPLQNSVHHETWCKACVAHYEEEGAAALEEEISNADEATKLGKRQAALEAPHNSAGSIRCKKNCFVAHILGSKQQAPCPYASDEAKTEAMKQKKPSKDPHNKPTTKLKRQISSLDTDTLSEPSSSLSTPASESNPPLKKKLKQTELKRYTPRDMLLSNSEVEAIQQQALHAVVSTSSKEGLFEDVEMLKLIGMLRKEAVAIMLTARVLGGRLLDNEAKRVDKKLGDILRNQVLGISTDQWKDIKKNAIAAVCVNVHRKSYTLELQDVTALPKDGNAQCEEFEKMIERTEKEYKCIVIYLVTDADGGSKIFLPTCTNLSCNS
ncbi:hypothetical protein D9758_018325 [Tetrapyrgos nigripes]|uniref:Uncharacterized protein n=1 Tax=Tetrapyrgos nigripes TaxID=182062 RepID=A0A8H5BBW5_9AGAR|nr:hypothetical protein D9758_018325 [Tetrapyrgos nigripes]